MACKFVSRTLYLVCYVREEHRLRVFKKGALRKLFGPKTDKVTGDWRKLHNEEVCDVYCSRRFVMCTAHGGL
jgi:hypothetical protein